MSSTQDKPLDLTPLSDKYDIAGEYSSQESNRQYPARRKEDGRDVLITVMRAAADVAQGKAVAQFAADANLLATLSHQNVPQVLEGRWIGDDAFALVTARVLGTTLAEMLKGDRLTNPRIADILRDIDGVLEWARGERLSHRNVAPQGVLVERGTGKVWVSLSPTDAPKTNRPDARDDARTIGALAITMLTAKPMGDDHDGTLISMRPDLPQRVVDATEKVAACTINDEAPNISAYLGALAMADAIKEGEVEVARVEAEFRAQMQAEREAWEAEQQAIQEANEAQAKLFAEERAEYERRSAKEKEQLETARGEIDKRRSEVQLARTELDEARADYKQKKSELEARTKQVDKHMADLERQKRGLEKRTKNLERRTAELEEKNQELQALTALAAAAGSAGVAAMDAQASPTSVDGLLSRIQRGGELSRPTQPMPVVEDEIEEADEPAQDSVEVMAEAIAAEEEVQGWTPIETEEPWTVPLETDEPVRAIAYEAAAVPEPEKKSGRPAWMVPASIAGLAVLAVGTAWGIRGRDSSAQAGGSVVASAPAASVVRTDTALLASGAVADSSAGAIAPLSDSATFTALRDSIIAADAARRARREQAAAAASAEAERRRAQTYTDSTGTVWSLVPPASVDSARRADSVAKVKAKAKRDSIAKVRPDTSAKPG